MPSALRAAHAAELHVLCLPSRHKAMLLAVESFVETDRSYLSNDSGSARDDGCTAVTAVLQGQRLIIANVGDSRAVLSRAGQGTLHLHLTPGTGGYIMPWS